MGFIQRSRLGIPIQIIKSIAYKYTNVKLLNVNPRSLTE